MRAWTVEVTAFDVVVRIEHVSPLEFNDHRLTTQRAHSLVGNTSDWGN